MIQFQNRKGGSKEIWGLDLNWKSRPVFSISKMELNTELGPWIKTILILGLEFPMNGQIRNRLYSRQHRNSCRCTRRARCTNKHKRGCSQVKGKSRTSTKSTRWDNSNHTNTWKKMDWYWAIRTRSRVVRSLAESDEFSSTQSRGGKKMEQLNSARYNFVLEIIIQQIQHWSDDRWKDCVVAGGGSKRRYQYCSDNSGTILYLRALQGHSANNLICPTLQDHVVIGTGIFRYIYHVGCAFNLHSMFNNRLIPGGQDLSKRQTVFFLPIDPRGKNHEYSEYVGFSLCTTSSAIRAQCMKEAPRRGIMGWY